MRDGVQEIHVAVFGKAGTGKTSLASALITNKSGLSGSFGPLPGTKNLIEVKTCRLKGISVYVYDTRGLWDGIISNKEIMEAFQQICPADKLDLVIACFRWDDRLDRANKRIFPVINKMDSNIWKKTVFALTFCDNLPPEYKYVSANEKSKLVNQKWAEWEGVLKNELKRLNIKQEVLCNIKICPTTHTEEKIEKCFSSVLACPWLVNLWINIIVSIIQMYVVITFYYLRVLQF